MGSPEKCDKCGGVGRHVEGKRGFTRFPCPNATPTPPAPADDAPRCCESPVLVCATCGTAQGYGGPADDLRGEIGVRRG